MRARGAPLLRTIFFQCFLATSPHAMRICLVRNVPWRQGSSQENGHVTSGSFSISIIQHCLPSSVASTFPRIVRNLQLAVFGLPTGGLKPPRPDLGKLCFFYLSCSFAFSDRCSRRFRFWHRSGHRASKEKGHALLVSPSFAVTGLVPKLKRPRPRSQ